MQNSQVSERVLESPEALLLEPDVYASAIKACAEMHSAVSKVRGRACKHAANPLGAGLLLPPVLHAYNPLHAPAHSSGYSICTDLCGLLV